MRPYLFSWSNYDSTFSCLSSLAGFESFAKMKVVKVVLLILWIPLALCSQNQRIADSVFLLLQEGPPSDSVHMAWLKLIAQKEADPVKTEQYADELIELSEGLNSYTGMVAGYTQKGNANRLMGNLEEALEWYFKGIDIANKEGDFTMVGKFFIAIADAYGVSGNRTNAIIFYNRAIDQLRSTTDSLSLGTALFNCGDEYLINEVYDTALVYFEESGKIFENIDFLLGTGYNLGNIGKVYAYQGLTDLAEANLNRSIEILEEFEDFYPISVYLLEMSEISFDRNEPRKAIDFARRSLDLAQRFKLKEQVSNAHFQLAELYESTGDFQGAYSHHKDHITYRDSINNIETVENLANLRTNFEVSEKQLEVDLLNEQKRAQRVVMIAVVGALFLIGLLAFGLYRRYVYIRKTNLIIDQERQRSEELLLNILPSETAEELKTYGHAKAKNYGMVTVIFTDFKEFTLHSERLTPEELVAEIDHCFKAFDKIMETYNVEKIKTVGDAYLAAAGLPVANESNPIDAVNAALAIREFMLDYQRRRSAEGQLAFEIRIGVNTGPIVAGIVGIKKFQYDIWGDTVNIAARMESSGAVGKVNISQSTYELIKNNGNFSFQPRGKVEAKHKGEIEMYFVEKNSK